MTPRRLIYWLTFLAVFAMASRVAVDTDTWWHLKTGQWILEHGSIPKVDIFSFTQSGELWKGASVGWMMQTSLYLIYSALGFGGLNLFQATMVTIAFIFVYHTISGGEFLKAFVIILAAASSGIYWAARPYMMSFVLAAVFLWVLESYREGKSNRLWLLPLLMMLWANSHGGFAIGFIIWGIYLVGEGFGWVAEARKSNKESKPRIFTGDWFKFVVNSKLGRMILIGGLMVLGVTINSSGPAMLLYPFETLSINVLADFIQEWHSPDFHTSQAQPFIWLLLLSLAAIGASQKKIAFTDFLLMSVLSYMSFITARNIAVFSLAAPIVLTKHASAALEKYSARLRMSGSSQHVSVLQSNINRFLLLIFASVVFLQMAVIFPEAANRKVFQDNVPVGAVEYLKSNDLPGELLNSYNWGGYLIWALPEHPVFVDGRTDLYGDEIITEWLEIVSASEGWQNKLDHWNVRLILLEPHWPVTKLLVNEGWQKVYEDHMSVIYALENE